MTAKRKSVPDLAIDPDFDEMRERVRKRDFLCHYGRTCVPGTLSIEAVLFDWPLPVGFIWYSFHDGERLTIRYVFTHEQFRRCGLGTALLDTLVSTYPGLYEVTTGRGNELSTPWLLANGFKHITARRYWLKTLKDNSNGKQRTKTTKS